ncbi:hypothetical protein BDF14DRAFT_1795011 [Spinellus fusiger]|nr:hypothetical protein BDF14DRAFT_1795011 [Spinellus fusiger]
MANCDILLWGVLVGFYTWIFAVCAQAHRLRSLIRLNELRARYIRYTNKERKQFENEPDSNPVLCCYITYHCWNMHHCPSSFLPEIQSEMLFGMGSLYVRWYCCQLPSCSSSLHYMGTTRISRRSWYPKRIDCSNYHRCAMYSSICYLDYCLPSSQYDKSSFKRTYLFTCQLDCVSSLYITFHHCCYSTLCLPA